MKGFDIMEDTDNLTNKRAVGHVRQKLESENDINLLDFNTPVKRGQKRETTGVWTKWKAAEEFMKGHMETLRLKSKGGTH